MANGFPPMSVNDADWNDLKFFLAVARAGSLTLAAQQLNTSVSTVSRHIDALERQLGVKLFLRQQSGYLLTGQGSDVLASMESVEQSILAVQRYATRAHHEAELRGSLRVATSEGLAAHIIAPALPAFFAQYPHIMVDLVASLTLANLQRREADMALRFVDPAEQAGAQDFISHPLGMMRFGAYCALSLLLSDEASWSAVPPALGLISWSREWSGLPMMQWLAQLPGERRAVMSSNNLIVHHEAARAGVGIALLPDYMAANDAMLRRLPLPGLRAEREIWMVYHRDLRGSPLLIAMRDWLKPLFEARVNPLAANVDTLLDSQP